MQQILSCYYIDIEKNSLNGVRKKFKTKCQTYMQQVLACMLTTNAKRR